MISTAMTLYADDTFRYFGYRCGCLPVPALCHNCTYLSGFDLLALIEFRLESSRAAGVLREEISFLKRQGELCWRQRSRPQGEQGLTKTLSPFKGSRTGNSVSDLR